MATLRGTQGQPGRTPWGWIIGLVVLAIFVFGVIWWMQRGAPPADVTGQEGVEIRGTPEAQQPGTQPPVLQPGPDPAPPADLQPAPGQQPSPGPGQRP